MAVLNDDLAFVHGLKQIKWSQSCLDLTRYNAYDIDASDFKQLIMFGPNDCFIKIEKISLISQ